MKERLFIIVVNGIRNGHIHEKVKRICQGWADNVKEDINIHGIFEEKMQMQSQIETIKDNIKQTTRSVR
jgi:hypothetical protein